MSGRPRAARSLPRRRPPPADVKIVYNHAKAIGDASDLVLDRANDLAVIRLARPHPDGYVVPRIDPIESRQIASRYRYARFIEVGYGIPFRKAPVALRTVEGQPVTIDNTANGRIVLELPENSGGVCRGNSGGPVLAQRHGEELKLIGVHTAGRLGSPLYGIAGSDDMCSRAIVFAPVIRLLRLLESVSDKWTAPAAKAD